MTSSLLARPRSTGGSPNGTLPRWCPTAPTACRALPPTPWPRPQQVRRSASSEQPAPTTAVLIPSNTATQSGTSALLDASASANVTFVKFELSGGTLLATM